MNTRIDVMKEALELKGRMNELKEFTNDVCSSISEQDARIQKYILDVQYWEGMIESGFEVDDDVIDSAVTKAELIINTFKELDARQFNLNSFVEKLNAIEADVKAQAETAKKSADMSKENSEVMTLAHEVESIDVKVFSDNALKVIEIFDRYNDYNPTSPTDPDSDDIDDADDDIDDNTELNEDDGLEVEYSSEAVIEDKAPDIVEETEDVPEEADEIDLEHLTEITKAEIADASNDIEFTKDWSVTDFETFVCSNELIMYNCSVCPFDGKCGNDGCTSTGNQHHNNAISIDEIKSIYCEYLFAVSGNNDLALGEFPYEDDASQDYIDGFCKEHKLACGDCPYNDICENEESYSKSTKCEEGSLESLIKEASNNDDECFPYVEHKSQEYIDAYCDEHTPYCTECPYASECEDYDEDDTPDSEDEGDDLDDVTLEDIINEDHDPKWDTIVLNNEYEDKSLYDITNARRSKILSRISEKASYTADDEGVYEIGDPIAITKEVSREIPLGSVAKREILTDIKEFRAAMHSFGLSLHEQGFDIDIDLDDVLLVSTSLDDEILFKHVESIERYFKFIDDKEKLIMLYATADTINDIPSNMTIEAHDILNEYRELIEKLNSEKYLIPFIDAILEVVSSDSTNDPSTTDEEALEESTNTSNDPADKYEDFQELIDDSKNSDWWRIDRIFTGSVINENCSLEVIDRIPTSEEFENKFRIIYRIDLYNTINESVFKNIQQELANAYKAVENTAMMKYGEALPILYYATMLQYTMVTVDDDTINELEKNVIMLANCDEAKLNSVITQEGTIEFINVLTKDLLRDYKELTTERENEFMVNVFSDVADVTNVEEKAKNVVIGQPNGQHTQISTDVDDDQIWSDLADLYDKTVFELICNVKKNTEAYDVCTVLNKYVKNSNIMDSPYLRHIPRLAASNILSSVSGQTNLSKIAEVVSIATGYTLRTDVIRDYIKYSCCACDQLDSINSDDETSVNNGIGRMYKKGMADDMDIMLDALPEKYDKSMTENEQENMIYDYICDIFMNEEYKKLSGNNISKFVKKIKERYDMSLAALMVADNIIRIIDRLDNDATEFNDFTNPRDRKTVYMGTTFMTLLIGKAKQLQASK